MKLNKNISLIFDILNKNHEIKENSTKLWIYKPNVFVVDFNIRGLKIAFNVEDRFNGVNLKIFGRDKLSEMVLKDVLSKEGEWNECHVYKNRLSLLFSLKEEREDFVAEKILRKINEIYSWLNACDDYEIREKIKYINNELLNDIRKKVFHGLKVKIGFLVTENAKWNSNSLWEKFLETPGIECNIYLALTGRDKTKDDRLKTYDQERRFFEIIDPNLIDLYDRENDKSIPLDKFEIDLIFYQQPWSLSGYIKKMLGKSLSAYMHYGFAVYANSKMQYRLPGFFPYLWCYFSQSELHKKIHLEHDPGIFGRQVVTGYPKLDVYLDPVPQRCDIWPNCEDSRKKIIYAPHHSLPKEALKISTFHWNHDLLLGLAKEHKNVQWIYKPHGRLRYVVEKNNVMTLTEYEHYVKEWATQDNTNVYDQGDYFDIFRTSDALITDSGSFLGEYMPTGKPIIWLISDKATVELNEIGKELSRGFYKVRSREELMHVFEDVVIKGNDPLKNLRMKIIKKSFFLKKKSANAVVDYLKSKLNI